VCTSEAKAARLVENHEMRPGAPVSTPTDDGGKCHRGIRDRSYYWMITIRSPRIGGIKRKSVEPESDRVFVEKPPEKCARHSFLRPHLPSIAIRIPVAGSREKRSSIVGGWRSGKFRTYKGESGWFRGTPGPVLRLTTAVPALDPLEEIARSMEWHDGVILEDLKVGSRNDGSRSATGISCETRQPR